LLFYNFKDIFTFMFLQLLFQILFIIILLLIFIVCYLHMLIFSWPTLKIKIILIVIVVYFGTHFLRKYIIKYWSLILFF